MSYVYMLLEYADGSRAEFGAKRAPQPCPACSAAAEPNSTAWSLADVLERLALAVDHLQGHHACDVHGYELDSAAARHARQIAAKLRAVNHAEGCPNQVRR